MKPEEVFKRYDIRGKYPEEIDKEFAEILGKAYGTFVNENEVSSVVVTTDTKSSSKEIKKNLVSGLKSTGLNVLDAGVGPTDYSALTAKESSAYSVQVTSSHLELDTNGFKFMYPEGNSLVNEDLDKIRENFRSREFAEGNGTVEDVSSPSHDLYRGEIEKFLKDHGLGPGKSVYLETLSGAGSEFLPGLLNFFSVEFKHSDRSQDPPDPSAHEFQELENNVDEGKYDLGVVTDMDADRAHFYYRGEWLDGSTVLSVLSRVIDPEKIVVSLDASKMIHEVFEGKVIETRVGDPFVLSEMVEEDSSLSGEPNNHFAFLDFVPYNSGTLTTMVMASADLDDILEDIPNRTEMRESYEVEDKYQVMEKIVAEANESYEVLSEKDGIKFSTGDTQVLVRKSGTSDKIRVVVDSAERDRAEHLLNQIERIIKKQHP